MKANRRFREQDGVSTVLGGILFFSLIVMFLVVVRLEFAPIWQEEDEAEHASRLQGQFAALKSEADRQAANVTSDAVSHPVTLLERTTSRFFSPPNLPGSLSFQPATADVTVSTNEFLIFSANGKDLLGIDEDWTDVSGGQSISEVEELRHLRVRLVDPGNEDDGDGVTLTVTDAQGQFAGDLTSYITEHPSGYSINVRVRSADGTIIYDQGESLFQQNQPPFWWIDGLAAELHFIDVLAAASKPMQIDLSQNGMNGQFTTTYVDGSSGSIVGSSGDLVTDYSRSMTGGALVMDGAYSSFVDQDLILEAGAVFIQQPDGAVMRTPGIFDVQVGGGITRIHMTLPSLDGISDTVTSGGTASVILDAVSSERVTGTAPRWDVSLESSHPTLWAELWQDALEDAGLSAASHFTISTNATHASLSIFGLTSAPASTEHDLAIRLEMARINVQIRS